MGEGVLGIWDPGNELKLFSDGRVKKGRQKLLAAKHQQHILLPGGRTAKEKRGSPLGENCECENLERVMMPPLSASTEEETKRAKRKESQKWKGGL